MRNRWPSRLVATAEEDRLGCVTERAGSQRRSLGQRRRLSKKQRLTELCCNTDARSAAAAGWSTLEHDDLERWCGGWALPWHRTDLGFFGAHALSRCARVARMDSCGPLLATHFLLEKQ
jgi:hypothetical protein